MQIEDELAQFSPPKETLLTIGVFDGVHLGHKFFNLQSRQSGEARKPVKLRDYFRQHPRDLLAPKTKLCYTCALSRNVSSC